MKLKETYCFKANGFFESFSYGLKNGHQIPIEVLSKFLNREANGL